MNLKKGFENKLEKMSLEKRCEKKCPVSCPNDLIVLRAMQQAYIDLGDSGSSVLTGVLSAPKTGLWTAYKQSGCRCCADQLHAQIFAQAITALTRLSNKIPFSDADLVNVQFLANVIGSYKAIEVFLNSYINSRELCETSCECRQEVQKVYLQAFSDIVEFGILVNGVNATYISAVIAYSMRLLGYQCDLNILQIGIVRRSQE